MQRTASRLVARRLILLAAVTVAVAGCGDAEVKAGAGTGDGGAPAASVMLTCGEGLPFPSSALETPTGAEKADGPEADVLRERIAHWPIALPATGWRVLVDDPSGVMYGAGQPPRMSAVTIRRKDGSLDAGPTGTCAVRRYRAGYGLATWKVHGIPRAESRDLVVDVTESACASGQPAGDRLQPAEVAESDDAVTLTFWVKPRTGNAVELCPGNPSTTVTVHLDQDLMGRDLLDGGWYPARNLLGDDDGDQAPPGAGGSSSSIPTETTGPGTTVTTVAPTGPPPADPDAAEAAIDKAFHDAFDAGVPQERRDAAVEDAADLREAGQEASAKYPQAADSISVTVHSVGFIDATHAAVNFELSYSGAMLLGPRDGQAVFVDGAWKVSRATRCAIIEQAGVACP